MPIELTEQIIKQLGASLVIQDQEGEKYKYDSSHMTKFGRRYKFTGTNYEFILLFQNTFKNYSVINPL